MSIVEILNLSDQEKLSLALSLLNEFGANNIRPPNSDFEVIHSCVLPFGLHRNGDSHPSASFNAKKLVYNCLAGCGSGGIVWFTATCRGIRSSEVHSWLTRQAGLNPEDLGSFLRYLEQAYSPAYAVEEPIPRYSKKILEPWQFVHPYMTEMRRISVKTLMKFSVGYDHKTQRVTIPHFWNNELVGWQSRRLINDGTPRYLSSPNYPRKQTIFNYKASLPAVVMEAPMSVLAQDETGVHAESTIGAQVTDRQIRLLANHPKVTLFFDNDDAGYNATRHVGDALLSYTEVWVMDNPYDADPADMSHEDYLSLKPVPYSIWSPPKELIPYVLPKG